jgi:hypothetical protein
VKDALVTPGGTVNVSVPAVPYVHEDVPATPVIPHVTGAAMAGADPIAAAGEPARTATAPAAASSREFLIRLPFSP